MSGNRKAWQIVAALWVVALLNYLDRQVIYSLFPLLRDDLRLSDLQLGLIGSSFLWIYALCSPFTGFLADRYGRKRVLIVSLLLWSAITWATAHVRTLPELLVARALMGVSEACYLPAALALIADHHGERTRSLATGLHYSGIYAGIVLGGAGGGWIGQHYGWRFAFTLLGIAGVLYTLILPWLLPDGKETLPEPGAPRIRFASSALEILTLPGFKTLMVVFAATSVGNWLVYTWMPLYLYERFRMNLAEAGFSATFYVQVGSIIGILAGGWLADRWARSNHKGRAYTQAAGLAMAAPFLFLAGFTSFPILLLIGLAVFGLGRGMYDANGMPVLSQLARPELRSTGFGLLNLAGTFAGGITAFAAGGLKATLGLAPIIQIAGVLLLVAAILLIRLPIRGRSPVESSD